MSGHLFLKSDFFQSDPGWIFLLIAALFNSVSVSVAKHQMNRLGKAEVFPLIKFIRYLLLFFKSPAVLAVFSLFMLSPFFWVASVSTLPLGIAYPAYYSLNLLFVFIATFIFLNERINIMKVTGALLLVAAFFLFYSF